MYHIVFKDLIIYSRTKCSVNLATTNSTGVRKWADDFSLFCFKNIYSTLSSVWRDPVSSNGGLNSMLGTALWVLGPFISYVLLHLFTSLIPLLLWYNHKSASRFQHFLSILVICYLDQHKSVSCSLSALKMGNPPIILIYCLKKPQKLFYLAAI